MRLDEIRARLEKATKGPWNEKWIYTVLRYTWKNDGPWNDVEDDEELQGNTPSYRGVDYKFIAHSPEDVAHLLALVDEAREIMRCLKLTEESMKVSDMVDTWLKKVAE